MGYKNRCDYGREGEKKLDFPIISCYTLKYAVIDKRYIYIIKTYNWTCLPNTQTMIEYVYKCKSFLRMKGG